MAFDADKQSVISSIVDNLDGTFNLVNGGGDAFDSGDANQYVSIHNATNPLNNVELQIDSADGAKLVVTSGTMAAETTDIDVTIAAAQDKGDWYLADSNGTALINSKVAHANAPLSSNPLTGTGYGTIARKFLNGGAQGSEFYLLSASKNPDFYDDANAQAISCVYRHDPANYTAPALLLRAQPGRGSAMDKYYWASAAFKAGGDGYRILMGGNTEVTANTFSDPNSGAFPHLYAVRTPSGDYAHTANIWHAMRFEATTEGSGVRLKVYYTDDLDTINGTGGKPWVDGEPDWSQNVDNPVINAVHVSGSQTPVRTAGDPSLGTFGDTVPNLAGSPGFGAATYGATDTVWLDRVRPSRMP